MAGFGLRGGSGSCAPLAAACPSAVATGDSGGGGTTSGRNFDAALSTPAYRTVCSQSQPPGDPALKADRLRAAARVIRHVPVALDAAQLAALDELAADASLPATCRLEWWGARAQHVVRTSGTGPLEHRAAPALAAGHYLATRASRGDLAARLLARSDLHGDQLALSSTLARRALEAREPVVAVDAAGEYATVRQSVHALRLRSVLAVPLIAQGEALGVVYLDDRVRRVAFGERELAKAKGEHATRFRYDAVVGESDAVREMLKLVDPRDRVRGTRAG